MTERPIPFSGPMVRALIAGTKTQTRRAIKGAPTGRTAYLLGLHRDSGVWGIHADVDRDDGVWRGRCPYGVPGDKLWVREAWRVSAVHDHVPGSELGFGSPPQVQYEAIGDGRDETQVQWGRYRHARFMPRWASRITLEVTEVRVERLQDISEADAIAEGVDLQPRLVGYSKDSGCAWKPQDPREAYCHLWEAINGAGSWEANLWVWAVSFKRVTP